jgi:hypothetical protein
VVNSARIALQKMMARFVAAERNGILASTQEFVAESMENDHDVLIFIDPGHRSSAIQTRDALSFELRVSRVGHAKHKVETNGSSRENWAKVHLPIIPKLSVLFSFRDASKGKDCTTA